MFKPHQKEKEHKAGSHRLNPHDIQQGLVGNGADMKFTQSKKDAPWNRKLEMQTKIRQSL